MKRKTLVAWSSGKDSAWALHCLRQSSEFEVVGLLTTLSEAYDRVAMHGVRRALLDAQAKAAGLPLWSVEIPSPCSNEDYEARMGEAIHRARAEGIEVIAFGDLFLEDIRAYRERQLEGSGVEPVFPLWRQATDALAKTMLEAGLQARLTCVDPRQVPESWAGRAFDASLISELPSGVDPCGENGEFHTFVHAGPMFSAPIQVTLGEVVTRDGFVFADLRPQEWPAAVQRPR